MESSSSDHDVELGWSWTSCHDGRDDKMMRQLHLQVPDDELSGAGAYSTQYESAEKLVSGGGNMSQYLIHEIKKQKDDDMGNWWSFSNGTTCTTANPCLTHHPPQAQADEVEAVREMMYRMAAMQPIEIDPDTVKPPKRRNVKISKDPQSVAARHRRQKISQRIRILQRLVPGGTKLDTASMLDEAIHYLKFLKSHLNSLQSNSITNISSPTPPSSNYPIPPHPHIQYYHIN